MDTTHWQLADGTGVEILNALDDHSRLALISTARTTFTGPEVDRCFRRATRRHGNPAAVLTDNGAIFTGLARGGGRVTLEKTLQARGIRPVHTAPTTRRPTARSNGSTRPSRSGYAASPPLPL